MNIKLIAMDLDGTLMNSSNCLSEYNRQALQDALACGISIVVASGRAFTSLPKVVLGIKGMQYAITSNGAHITDLRTNQFIYSSYIAPEAVDAAIELAEREKLMLEAFCDGQPYIQRNLYEDIRINGSVYRNKEYVLTTRKPMDDLAGFMRERRNTLENINFFFYDTDRLEKVRPMIEAIPNTHVTSSVKNNVEMGSAHSTKAEALIILAKKLGLPRDGIMSFGDAPNDIPMIQYAGFGVAMGNAWDEVKAEADYIAETNDENGVGRTIRKYALKEM